MQQKIDIFIDKNSIRIKSDNPSNPYRLYRQTKDDKSKIIIKVIKKSVELALKEEENFTMQQGVEKEIYLLQQNHPHFVNLNRFEAIPGPNKEDKQIILYLENCEICLKDQQLEGTGLIQQMKELAEAIQYMHRQGISHLNLNDCNIMFTEQGKLKLTNFGQIRNESHNRQEEEIPKIKNFRFQSPEILGDKQFFEYINIPYQPHSFPADIWSYGIIIYKISQEDKTCESPFIQDKMSKFYIDILKKLRNNKKLDSNLFKNFKKSLSEKQQQNLIDLLHKIFILDPSRRINIQQILNHPLFRIELTIPLFFEKPRFNTQEDILIDGIQQYVKLRNQFNALKRIVQINQIGQIVYKILMKKYIEDVQQDKNIFNLQKFNLISKSIQFQTYKKIVFKDYEIVLQIQEGQNSDFNNNYYQLINYLGINNQQEFQSSIVFNEYLQFFSLINQQLIDRASKLEKIKQPQIKEEESKKEENVDSQEIKEIMIVLGTQKSRDLNKRIDLAVQQIKNITTQKKLIVICSGLGEDNLISEAKQIYQSIMFHSLQNTEIMIEENSMNTVENAVFVLNILFHQFFKFQPFYFNLHLVTSEYHCERALLTFKKVAEQIKLKYRSFNLINIKCYRASSNQLEIKEKMNYIDSIVHNVMTLDPDDPKFAERYNHDNYQKKRRFDEQQFQQLLEFLQIQRK